MPSPREYAGPCCLSSVGGVRALRQYNCGMLRCFLCSHHSLELPVGVRIIHGTLQVALQNTSIDSDADKEQLLRRTSTVCWFDVICYSKQLTATLPNYDGIPSDPSNSIGGTPQQLTVVTAGMARCRRAFLASQSMLLVSNLGAWHNWHLKSYEKAWWLLSRLQADNTWSTMTVINYYTNSSKHGHGFSVWVCLAWPCTSNMLCSCPSPSWPL